MIPPRLQWCHQVAVTSMCWPKAPSNGQLSACSNCTRLLAHEQKRYFMTPDQFRSVVLVARDFIYQSPPDLQGRANKVIGIFGGEPLMSPHFPAYVDIACELIPQAIHRGLWTSFDWPTYVNPKWGAAAPWVHKLLGEPRQGYLNWNMHEEEQQCHHHPVLVSISDVIQDEKRRMELISECWLNRDWSAAYCLDHNGEPKFYFCEISGAFDRVMRLDLGLPVEPGIWNHDLTFALDERGILMPQGIYAPQIMGTCTRCGQALPQKEGRRDREWKDDISPSNLVQLQAVGSPMVARGDFVEFGAAQIANYDERKGREGYEPMRYIKKGIKRSSSMQHVPNTSAKPRRKVRVVRKGKKK